MADIKIISDSLKEAFIEYGSRYKQYAAYENILAKKLKRELSVEEYALERHNTILLHSFLSSFLREFEYDNYINTAHLHYKKSGERSDEEKILQKQRTRMTAGARSKIDRIAFKAYGYLRPKKTRKSKKVAAVDIQEIAAVDIREIAAVDIRGSVVAAVVIQGSVVDIQESVVDAVVIQENGHAQEHCLNNAIVEIAALNIKETTLVIEENMIVEMEVEVVLPRDNCSSMLNDYIDNRDNEGIQEVVPAQIHPDPELCAADHMIERAINITVLTMSDEFERDNNVLIVSIIKHLNGNGNFGCEEIFYRQLLFMKKLSKAFKETEDPENADAYEMKWSNEAFDECHDDPTDDEIRQAFSKRGRES